MEAFGGFIILIQTGFLKASFIADHVDVKI